MTNQPKTEFTLPVCCYYCDQPLNQQNVREHTTVESQTVHLGTQFDINRDPYLKVRYVKSLVCESCLGLQRGHSKTN